MKREQPRYLPANATALLLGAKPAFKSVAYALAASAIIVAINVSILAIDGRLSFHPYDPIGNILLAQNAFLFAEASRSNFYFTLLTSALEIDSGLHIFLIALLFKVYGMGIWQPCLVLFWQTFLIILLVNWMINKTCAYPLRFALTMLVATLPPLMYAAHQASRLGTYDTIIGTFIWPPFPGVDWAMDGAVQKADLLAGAALAWSVALITVRRSEARVIRFFASGAMISLAILSKGHFAPVYLAVWGIVIVVNAIAMKENGPTYVWRSYAAALPLGCTLIAWYYYGGLDSSIRYYYYGWHHPLKGSADYMPLGGGITYFLSLMPVGIGFIPGGFLLILMLFSISALTRKQVWDTTSSAITFAIAAIVMLIPIFANPFGRNLSMMLPVFVLLWMSMISIIVESYSHQPMKARQVTVGTVAGVLSIIILVLGTFYGLRALQPNRDEYNALREDRDTLYGIADILSANDVRRIISPLMATGLPDILKYAIALQIGPLASNKVFSVPAIWSDSQLERDPDFATKMAAEVAAHDIIIIIRGGAKLFPDLGGYMALSYSMIERIIDDNSSRFIKVYSRNLKRSPLQSLYFRRAGNDMTVEVFRRQN